MKTMNKYIMTLLLLALTLSLEAAPVKLTTNKAQGEQLNIALNSGLQVVVNWNNGETETFVSDGDLTSITVKGTTAEINTNKDITSLYLGNNGITELTFDITANAIKQLYCPQNALTALDLSFCQNLVELNCQDNQLKEITIASTVLESCDLSNNQLEKVTLPNNGEYLTTLALSGNQIAELEGLDQMQQLKTLFIANNEMTGVSLKKNKQIRNIVAYNNALTQLQTEGLKNLNQVWISNNKLEKLDVAEAKHLVSLKADKNNLNQINWTKDGNDAFRFIDISDNSLFFNSLPTIYDSEKQTYTVEAHILPQRPYILAQSLTEQRTYSQWKDVFTTNGWAKPTALQTTFVGQDTLSTPADYVLDMGYLTFNKPQEKVVISANSAEYPGITLETAPFKVEEKRMATVTFNYLFNGKSIGTENKEIEIGTEANALPVKHEKDFCSYEFTKKIIEFEKDTVNVDVIWKGPFEFSASFDKAVWYYLTINSADKHVGYLYHIDNRPINLSAEANSSLYYWAFMGDPWHIKVLNLSQGKDKCLSNTPNYPKMDTEDCSWTIFAANAQKGKFLLHSEPYGYTSYQGHAIRYSKSATQSAHLIVKKAPEIINNYAEKVLQEITPFFDAEHLGHYFELTQEAYDTYKDEVKAAEKTCDEPTFLKLKKILNENMTIPADGFYRLKNVSTNGYLHAKSKDAIHCDGDANSIEAIVEIRSVLPPGTYYKEKKPFFLIQDKWCSNTFTNNTTYLMDNKGNFAQYLPIAPGKFAFAIAYYNARPGWEQHLATSYYTAGTDSQVIGSKQQPDANNTESIWTIEDATAAQLPLEAVGEAYYGTFYAPYAVTVNNGTAHTVTVENEMGQLHEIEGTVPARTPVLIVSNDKQAAIGIQSAGTSPLTSSNVLQGNLLPTAKSESNFYLGAKEGVPGFFTTGIETRTYNNAFVPQDKSANEFVLNLTPTGIETIVITKDTQVYDLQGRRVFHPQSGVYIVNHKKVYVK